MMQSLLAETRGLGAGEELAQDDRLRIGADGAIEMLGPTALGRLKEHPGTFSVLPAGRDVIVLKRAPSDVGPERRCLLFGEIAACGNLHEVIQFLGHARWRGELVVESRGTRRSLFFDEAHVVAAETNAPEEAIGEVLYRAGVLTREQVAACSKAKVGKCLLFGEAAVVLGFVDEARLFREMGRQIDAIFAAVARVRDGVFTFLEGFDDARLSFRRKLPVEVMLLEAIRGIDEADSFRTRIPTSNHVAVPVATSPPPSDPLGLYAALDGKRSVAALCASRSASELEVTRALYELVQSGHVTIAPPPTDVTRVVEVYNGAIVVLLRELDAMGEGDAVREKLARFASDAQYKEFFEGAGPADDGTLDADVVAQKVRAAGDPSDAEKRVGSHLYDYASYALFLARPHLERREREHNSSGRSVSKRVADMLAPIAPKGGVTMPPDRRASPGTASEQASPTLAPAEGAPDAQASATMAPSSESTLVVPDAPGRAAAAGPTLSVTARLPRAKLPEFPGVDPTRTARIPAFVPERAVPESNRTPPSPRASAAEPFTPQPPTAASPTPAPVVASAMSDAVPEAIVRAKKVAALCATVAVVATVVAAVSVGLLVR